MKRAFTLIELIVYMALLGFIIVVAGRVFSDSTAMRVRSQNMIKNSEEIGRVSNLLREDISQMGAKTWWMVTAYPEIYWNKDNGDVSSYALRHRKLQENNKVTFRDSIAFRKAAFDKDGLFLGIREIVWKARNDSLFRSCATIKKCTSGNCSVETDEEAATVCLSASSATAAEIKPVLIAKGIANFKIVPGKPGIGKHSAVEDTLFGKTGDQNFRLNARPDASTANVKGMTTQPSNSGSKTIVSNFAQNQNTTGKDRNELYLTKFDENANTFDKCHKMTFETGETYSIEFKMPYSISDNSTPEEFRQAFSGTQFVPDRDHLAVGLRKSNGDKFNINDGAPNDILFYPPQSNAAAELLRRLEFSVKDNKIENACVVISVAYYPPTVTVGDMFNAAKGRLEFSDFKVFRNADGTFHFPKEVDTGYEADYGTEDMTPPDKKIGQKTKAKAFEILLEIENRGEKSGTYSSEGKGMVVTTPNNGTVPQN
jgi:type II secretory pathway pseudopilin PulG